MLENVGAGEGGGGNSSCLLRGVGAPGKEVEVDLEATDKMVIIVNLSLLLFSTHPELVLRSRSRHFLTASHVIIFATFELYYKIYFFLRTGILNTSTGIVKDFFKNNFGSGDMEPQPISLSLL